MTNAQTQQSGPDLYSMLLFQRNHPLAFCYGVDERNELVSTTLEQATPLLVIDSTRAAHVYFIDTLLLQFYTKTDLTALRVCLVEQQMRFTPLFGQGPLTIFSVNRASGLMEAFATLEAQLQQREEQQAVRPCWLVIVELEASLYQNPAIQQHLSTLLTRGHARGIYPLLIATGQDVIRAHLPLVFRHTVVLPREEQRTGAALRSCIPGVLIQSSLSKQEQALEPGSLFIPRADADLTTQLIGRLTGQLSQTHASP